MKNSNFQNIGGIIICLLTVVGLIRVFTNPDVFGPFFSVVNDLRVLIPFALFLIPGIILITTKRNISIPKTVTLLVVPIVMSVIFSGSFSGFAPAPVIIDMLLLPLHLIISTAIILSSKKDYPVV